MKITNSLLAAVLAHQTVATWDMFGKPFPSPQYANNQCDDKQKAGFDWSDLQIGSSNFQYGDFDFSKGWKCDAASGKRDVLSKRTFGGKAIFNKCSKQQPASFGCSKRPDGFSITTIDISVEFDVEVDLHYTMGDGSICKQKASCKQEGSTITNTQCGGAKSVDVYLGSGYKGSKSDCNIGFHNIGFDCNPGKTYTPPPPPSPPTSKPSPPKPSPPSCNGENYGYGSGKDCSSASPPPPPGKSSTPPSSPSSPSCNGGYGPGCPPATTAASTPSSCEGGKGKGCSSAVASSQSTPANSYPAQTPPASIPAISSPAPYGNSSTQAVPPSSPPPSQETSKAIPPPPPSEKTSTPEAKTTSAATSSPPSQYTPSPPPPQSSSPSYPPYKDGTIPPQLPQCMNTWLQISTVDCKDNTNADCYCKDAKFTAQVIDCVQAWCETDEQTKAALQFLVGICASYVPQNPGLVSNCPNDTFTPQTPPSSPSGGSAKPSPPVSGSTISAAPPAGSSAPPMPSTTIVYSSTTVTVPAVHFSTQPADQQAGAPSPTAPVALVPGNSPAQVPASTTGAPYPVGTTFSVRPTGTGALKPSSPAQFTGAASMEGVDAAKVFAGAVLAMLVL